MWVAFLTGSRGNLRGYIKVYPQGYGGVALIFHCLDSFELWFTPALNFEATGERIPFGLLREHNEECDERAELARAMREEGKSYRQIAEELGYKSPQSVSNLLNRA